MTLHANPLAAAIRGAGGGGKGGGQARTPIESPDSLRSVAYARVLDLWCEGEIYGFADQANPLRCVFFNETVVANDDGTYNFRNFQIDSRVGTQTQDPMEGFAGVESEVGINTQLEFGSPWVRTFNNINLTAVRVRLSVPALMKTDTETGDTKGSIVRYKIELSTDAGAYVTKLDTAFDGKATNEYERSHRIALPPAATGWNLRVTRLTEESADISLQNQTWVESVTEIIDAKLRMPMSAYAGIVIDAEQFNSIPSRAYHLRGRILRVPSNYDPETRTYDGVWDGTFKSAYSNNPAWVFYDMATNSRYGLGHLVPAHLVDKWALYKIAQYCDELVDDGYGGQEPRFTANVYLQTQEDALRVMQNLASIFRGIIYVAGGTIVPVGDMPSDPIYNYAPGNVIGHKFHYSGSGRKVRHTVALVSWNDMSDMGRAKIEYVEDTDGIARYGVQQTEVIGIGCTSRGQARRMGRYILTTERYETDLATFGVGLDGVLVAPGKVIRIADPTRAGRRTGGRIKLATVNTITVDKAPILEIGDDIVVPLPDGTTEQRTISGINGALITVGTPFSQIPVAQGVWVLESPTLATQRYRVLAVTERDDGLGHDITAIQHVEGKFNYVENGVMIEEPPVSDRPNNVLAAPTNLLFTQRDVADTNTTQKIVTVSWSPVAQAATYAVSYRHNSATWIELGNASSTLIDIPALQPGTLEVRVTAINSVTRSMPAYGGPFDIVPNAKPPGVVTEIQQDVEDAFAAITTEVTNRLADRQLAADNLAAEAAEIRSEVDVIESALQGQVNGLSAQVGDIISADEHSTANTYVAGELVKKSGTPNKLYRSKIAVPAGIAITDTTYWTLIGDYSSLGEATSAALTRVGVTESRLNNTGAGKTIEVVASDLASTIATINHATTGLASKASITSLNTVTGRLNNTGAGRTIEQVASALVVIEGAVNHATTGLASKASVASLTTVTNRLNDTGAGRSVEQVASDVVSIQGTINDPSTGLGSKASVTNLNTVINRLDNAGGTGITMESVAQSVVSLKAAIGGAALPSTFEQGGLFFTPNRVGDPATMADYPGNVVADGTLDAQTLVITDWSTAGHNILTKGVVPAVTGRIYRVTARFKASELPVDGSASFNLVCSAMDESYAAVDVSFSSALVVSGGAAQSISFTYGASAGNGADYAWPAGSSYLRFGLRLETSETGLAVRIAELLVEDVTDAKANSTAIQSINATVSTHTGQIAAGSNAITLLQNALGGANAEGYQGLHSLVTGVDGLASKASAASVTSLTAKIDAKPNLLLNPSAGVNIDYWQPSFGLIRQELEGHTRFRFTTTGTGTHILAYYHANTSNYGIPIDTEATHYSLSAEVYNSNANTGNAYAQIRFHDAAGALVGSGNINTNQAAPANDWQLLTHDGAAIPVGAVYVTVRIVKAGGNTGANVYFRRVKLEANPVVTVYNTEQAVAKASELMTAEVDALTGVVEAMWSVTLDVNNYVSGVYSTNNGSVAEFAVLADVFKVVQPGGGAGLVWEDGVLWNRGATHSVILGQNFGASQDLLLWAGPNPTSPDAASKSNAVFWLDNAGQGFFAGALQSGLLKFSKTGTDTGATASVVLGPFNTNGGAKTVSGKYFYFQRGWLDGNVAATYNGQAWSASGVLERSVDNSAWVSIGTWAASGTRSAEYDAENTSTRITTLVTDTDIVTDNYATADSTYYMRMRITARSAVLNLYDNPLTSGGTAHTPTQELTITSSEG